MVPCWGNKHEGDLGDHLTVLLRDGFEHFGTFDDASDTKTSEYKTFMWVELRILFPVAPFTHPNPQGVVHPERIVYPTTLPGLSARIDIT